MKKLLRAFAAAVLGVSLSAGLVAASSTIDNTGQGSDNGILHQNDYDVDLDNTTDVGVDVDNDQDADSGDATADRNTDGGDAFSGNAANDSELVVEGEIDNTGANAAALSGNNGGGSDDASIDTTGQNSDNRIVFDNDYNVDVDNDTDLRVDVDNDQNADSGDAVVSRNTSGGQAVSGHATNTSSTTVDFTVSN